MQGPSSAPRPRKPRRRWRWHIPPAITRADETLAGTLLLEEVPGSLGLLLWQSMRDVELWASVEGEERSGLFAEEARARRLEALAAAAPGPELAEPLRTVAEMLGDPAATDEEPLRIACLRLSEWAEARGHLNAAVALAQAGAFAAERHAAASLRVGRLARRNEENARAETWYRRAVGLGRQTKDWASYAEAFLGLGGLYQQRGNLPAARRLNVRALRASRRHSLRDQQGRALHALATIAIEAGRVRDAQEHARGALRAYGAGSPHLPALARDLGYFWMTRGRFAPALAVFRALLPHFDQTPARVAALGHLARAAGAAGERDAFEEGWDALWDLVPGLDSRENAAQALADLAAGAASLGEWARAERAAGTALEIAEQRREGRVALTAEAVLDSVRHRRPPEPSPDGVENGSDDLAADLVRTLRDAAPA